MESSFDFYFRFHASLDQEAFEGTTPPDPRSKEEKDAWIAHIHKLIDPFVQAEMVAFDEKKKQYSASMVLSQGELKLNGKLVPLPRRF